MDIQDLLFADFPTQDVLLTLALVVSISAVAADIGFNDTIACSIGYVAAILYWYYKYYTKHPDTPPKADCIHLSERACLYEMMIIFGPRPKTEKSRTIRKMLPTLILLGSFESTEGPWRTVIHLERRPRKGGIVVVVEESRRLQIGVYCPYIHYEMICRHGRDGSMKSRVIEATNLPYSGKDLRSQV